MMIRSPKVAVAVAALAASAASALPAPTAGAANTYPIGVPAALPAGVLADGCGTSGTVDGQGRTGGNLTNACTLGGLSFVGPSTSISNVVGPTIISPVFVGYSVVAGGNVAIGP
jgi:hypothetical protein